jgi:hypothetical protein
MPLLKATSDSTSTSPRRISFTLSCFFKKTSFA